MYNENLSYDKNGNIMNLSRYGDRDEQYLPIQIDNLQYGYATNSNKLMSVVDNSNNTSGFKDGNTTGDDYVYDANGNMTVDKNKNITAITYNHLNLPTKIIFPTGNIVYFYTASGQKVQKVVTENTTLTTTDYLGGYQYKNAFLQFFPTAEGYVKNTPVSGTNTYSYVFNYTDHLGNTRLSYAKDTTTGSLKILEENNYYPFGLKHNSYNVDNFQPEYKYRYQSQEFQDELGLNIYFFKFRMSDPTTGRFLQIDPLSPTYAHNSTYAFAENNVTSGTDLEGLELSFNLQGDRATVQSGPRVTGGVSGNYTLQELRSHMAQKQAKYDRAMSKIMPSDPRALPRADIHLPSSDIRVARFNDPGMMMADGARIGAEMMAMDIAVAKIFQGVGMLAKGESVWALNAIERGRRIETMLGENLGWNFPIIDKIKDGVATSIKSLDLGASSYQKGNNVFNTLKGYINKLADFTSAEVGGVKVTQGETYTSKVLELAVQTGKGTESQWNQINNAIQYALDKNINVTIKFIK